MGAAAGAADCGAEMEREAPLYRVTPRVRMLAFREAGDHRVRALAMVSGTRAVRRAYTSAGQCGLCGARPHWGGRVVPSYGRCHSSVCMQLSQLTL